MVFFKRFRYGSPPRQLCAALCLRYARARARVRVRVRVLRLVGGIQGVTNRRVLSWALQDFAPVVEVPVLTCQRADCKACAKYASADDTLSRPYRDHQSPSRRELDIEVKLAARVRWRDQCAAQVDAQVTSRMSECPQLDEQDLRAAITKQAEVETETAVRDELAAVRFLPKLRTCTRCWTGEMQSRQEIIGPARLAFHRARVGCSAVRTGLIASLSQWHTVAKNAKPLIGRCTRRRVRSAASRRSRKSCPLPLAHLWGLRQRQKARRV